MILDHNDWRLTAYALNELDDADREEVEAAIAASPELARTVDDIRDTANVLQSALSILDEDAARLAEVYQSPGREPGNVTAGSRHAALINGPHFGTEAEHGIGQAHARRYPLRRFFLPLAVAASIALAAGVGWFTFAPRFSRARELSRNAVAPSGNQLAAADAKKLRSLGYLGGSNPGTAAPQSSKAGDRAQEGSSIASRPAPAADRQALVEEEKEIYTSIEHAIDQGNPPPAELVERLRSLAAVSGEGQGLVARLRQQNLQMQAQRALEGNRSTLSPEALEKLRSLGYIGSSESVSPDFAQCKGISYGHQVPYGPRATSSGDVLDNRLALANDKGPFFASPGEDLTRCIKFDLHPATDWFLSASACQDVAGPEISSLEAYHPIQENPFRLVENDPLSTFSIDVDTASYANVRRLLTGGALPPPDAVRIEEMINYFDYAYPQPVDEHPFAVHVEVAQCPWNGAHRLARIGIKGYEIAPQDRPPANLVFLIDVSGSMQPPNKLPLLREALSLMIDELNREDTVGIVVYAGASGIVLSPTNNKDVIRGSLNGLMAGGGTNGAAGIEAAYQLAEDTFVPGGINRVILATDGDFNVGVTSSGDLQRLIEEKAKSSVFLTVLGFGMGNYKDGTLETLADKGNGNYAYIDTLSEAQKVLIEQMEGTLVTIAKDVKIQVEFNPLAASAYRLIGYENRMLAAQDFNDDKKDAGEIGAGHTVTALYEIVPAGMEVDVPPVDELKYQTVTEFTPAADSGELMTVKLRYKEPDGKESKLIEMPVADSGASFAQSSDDFAFAASVATFGMLLRHSEHVGTMTFAEVAEFAEGAKGQDFYGYRAEFIDLVRRADALSTPE